MGQEERNLLHFIAKYENGKPIMKTLNKVDPSGVNGCVGGPPCPTCHWSRPASSSTCSSGLWCDKPHDWPCPGWP